MMLSICSSSNYLLWLLVLFFLFSQVFFSFRYDCSLFFFHESFTHDKWYWIMILQWNIKRLCFEFDTEPYAQRRDKIIKVGTFPSIFIHLFSIHSYFRSLCICVCVRVCMYVSVCMCVCMYLCVWVCVNRYLFYVCQYRNLPQLWVSKFSVLLATQSSILNKS